VPTQVGVLRRVIGPHGALRVQTICAGPCDLRTLARSQGLKMTRTQQTNACLKRSVTLRFNGLTPYSIIRGLHPMAYSTTPPHPRGSFVSMPLRTDRPMP
jgi:hypothetical protein